MAVGLVSEELIKKMSKRTAAVFDECYRYLWLSIILTILGSILFLLRTDQMNNFLWSVLLYFEAFLEHDKAKCDENVYIPG